ncbi:MAG: endonuclease/exonuclease/phosphatase family protein [Bauldia sp.]|nr:endonuclease/exonuclease/phosphatase family protein [Bauldia sp.]
MHARLLAATALIAVASALPTAAQDLDLARADGTLRIATFNASLNRFNAGELITALSDPASLQPARVAEIIQRVHPDIVLINEFDFDEDGEAARLFVENFLGIGQNGAAPWVAEAWFTAPSNTGVPSGLDFNRDGNPAGPDDAYGFGFFPGQYGMLVLSKYPIATGDIRTFRNFLWRDMPDALLPDDPETPEPADYYSPEILDVFRLSSKSHWDVPVIVGGTTIHILASHPTPPVFDGPEDRNGTRNHDEVRFWTDYIMPEASAYIVDDAGIAGGLAADASFVIVGDLNLDPHDGDGIREMGRTLLALPRLQDPMPSSAGGPEDATADGGKNADHTGDPALDTADFADTGEFDPGNLRADYVLPSSDLTVAGAGVFWPVAADPLAALLMAGETQTSDHRLVWVDIALD